MPVIVTVRMHAKEESRKDFIKDVTRFVSESRKEEGCVSCDCAESVTEPGYFVISEEWLASRFVDAHFETEHFKRFAGKLNERCKERPVIRLYRAESVDTL